MNLCHHKEDFDLFATWKFFATSHGKSPCDGIGGTVERILRKESLQRKPGDLIDSAEKVVQFCSQQVEGIKFWLLTEEELSDSAERLQARFSLA